MSLNCIDEDFYSNSEKWPSNKELSWIESVDVKIPIGEEVSYILNNDPASLNKWDNITWCVAQEFSHTAWNISTHIQPKYYNV